MVRISAALLALALMLTGLSLLTLAEGEPVVPAPPTVTTAEQINSAVAALSDAASTEEIDALADAARACQNQNRLEDSVITKLDGLYQKAHGFTQTVRVSSDGFSGSSKMPSDSDLAGGTVAAGGNATLYIDQRKPSGSGTDLQFELTLNSTTRLAAPVVLRIGLPDNWNNSRDYVLRGPATPAYTISRPSGGDRYYLYFTASTLGVYKLVRESSSSGKDYDIPAFWRDVIYDIRNAGKGETVAVNAGTRSTIAADVLRELEGRPVTLLIRRTGEPNIRIYGKDVRSISDGRDTYTMDSLAIRYGAAEPSSPSSRASSSQALSSDVDAVDVVIPAPVQSPDIFSQPALPPAKPSASSVAPVVPEIISSSAQSADEADSSIPELSEPEEREIVAEEDSRPHSDASESKPQKQTGADASGYSLLAVGTVLLAAGFSGVITLVIWNAKRKNL